VLQWRKRINLEPGAAPKPARSSELGFALRGCSVNCSNAVARTMQVLETNVFRPSQRLASPLSAVILVCLVAMVCYNATEIAYVLLGIPPIHIASFWPATPFLVAVLLLTPRRIWPLLIAAGLGALAIADFRKGIALSSEIWFSAGNLVDILIATFGIHWLFKGKPHLRSANALAKYMAIAVILAPCVSALVGATGSQIGGYWLQWRLWFFADALGFLTVTPAILSWVYDGRAWAGDLRNYLELTALLTWLSLLGYLTFMGTGWRNSPALLYSLVPPLLWAALRLGLKGVSTSMLIVSLMSIWGAAHDHGPFTGQGPLNNALSLQLFLFFAGIPFMLLAVLVEEEKQTRNELIDEHAQLTEAERVAQLGSWRWELSTNTVTWSDELYRLAGRDFSLPPLQYEELGQLYTAESWNRLRSAVERALAARTPYELDLEMIRPDGGTRWVRARGEVQCSSNGQVTQLYGTLQDITERKLAEMALRESEARFHDLFRDAGVGMIIVSPDGHFLAANETFCGYLGYTEEELRQMSVQSVTQPEDWPSFSTKLYEVLKTGASFQRFEKRCRHKSGRTVYTESSASLIRSPSGEPRYFVGEVLDVTERKRVEELLTTANQRVIQAQEQEAARIARDLHDDISQQLAMLMIKMDLMKKGMPMSWELREQIEELSRQAEKISFGVRSISHRLHSSKLEYLGMVSAMKGHCKESAKQHKVQIDFTHDDVLPTVSYEVSLCLFRVLQEALRNAVKHSGAQRFEVRLHENPKGIGLTVSDSGVGFDPEAAMNRGGLGLVSMRERLRLVRGTLLIGAKPGGGTTIDAFIPTAQDGKSQAAAG
jgi:PAS domain S-box-containing protein